MARRARNPSRRLMQVTSSNVRNEHLVLSAPGCFGEYGASDSSWALEEVGSELQGVRDVMARGGRDSEVFRTEFGGAGTTQVGKAARPLHEIERTLAGFAQTQERRAAGLYQRIREERGQREQAGRSRCPTRKCVCSLRIVLRLGSSRGTLAWIRRLMMAQ